MSGALIRFLSMGAAIAMCAKGSAGITMIDKTLVAWASPSNLEQQGGGVLSIGAKGEIFDAIVFGEIAPRRWMAGSNFYERTHRDQAAWPEETSEELVQIAIVYEGRLVTILRDGAPYAGYEMAVEPAEFSTDQMVMMGLRHHGATGDPFAGEIEDARIYDIALDAETIAALTPNELTGPKPVGWWPFKKDSPNDRMGNFADGQLIGGAEIEDGRLHLDGKGAALVSRSEPTVVRTEMGWPKYHITALEDEGIGMPYDANGCIYWKGKYHLMYIFQRDGQHLWGHASSPNLVSWTFHPAALGVAPEDPDRGIFSGNAFVNKDGVPMLCWFGIDAGVCVATATDDDLIHWEKHPNNPIIPMPKEGEPGHGVYNVWDPYLWLEDDTYICLLGGNKAENGRDSLYTCTSPDLISWEYKHAFYEGDPDWRREDEDCSCPDFFKLGDKHVLMCISHPIGGRFYVGEFDAAEAKFHPEQHVRMNWPGSMFFAPESLEAPDGRRIFWAWVTDPRTRPAQEVTGSGFQSLPRVLALGEDGAPRITPAEELLALRRKRRRERNIELPRDGEVTLRKISGARMELNLEIEPGTAEAIGVKVRCSPDGEEETAIWYRPQSNVLRLDMSRSTLRDDVTYGSPPFASYGLQKAADNGHPYESFEGPLELDEGETLKLRIFMDGPMLEVFANDRQCLTQVIFPEREDSVFVRLAATGGTARLVVAEAWEMAGLRIADHRKDR